MDIDQPVFGNGLGDRGAEQLARAVAIERVDAMDDQRLGLGEALRQHPCEEQMLGGAGAATLAQHPFDRAVARTTVRQGSDSLDEIGERCAGAAKRIAVYCVFAGIDRSNLLGASG
jgi:hypothetical protein